MKIVTPYGQTHVVQNKVLIWAWFVVFTSLLASQITFAQSGPPSITYTTPNEYLVKTLIPPLTPNNTGGTVANVIRNTIMSVAGSDTRIAGHVDLPGTGAKFDSPGGLAVDAAGNLYIADRKNDAIRKIALDGTVSTVATTGLDEPWAIEVNPTTGDLYVSNYGDHKIMKITPSGVVSTFAGITNTTGTTDGPALTAKFDQPQDLIFDAAGNLYVADSGNRLIRKITPQGIVSTIAGTGNPGKLNGQGVAASFNTPTGLTLDRNGNLIIADYYNNLIRKMTPGGLVSTFAGTSAPGFGDGPALSALLWNPSHMVTDYAGNIIFSDSRNDRIRMISAAGAVTTISGNGQRGDDANGNPLTAEFFNPVGLAYDRFANLYIADEHNNKIKKLALGGYTISRINDVMEFPAGLIFDPTTGIISGTPDELWPETRYKVTAYNGFGESSYEFTIKVIPTSVYMAKLPTITVCDPDLDPAALSNLAVTYSSSNPSVAIIVDDKVHPVGPGTTIITATNTNGESDTRMLEVLDFAKPVVRLSADKTELCPGSPALLTVTSSGAGSSPDYEWFKNGVSIGNNLPTYTVINPAIDDEYTVTVTNNDYCKDVVSLPSVPMVINPVPPAPTVSISVSPAAPACAGTMLRFTAVTPGNTVPATNSLLPTDVKARKKASRKDARTSLSMGPTPPPAHMWLVNGIDAGIGSPVFTSDKLVAGDKVQYAIPYHNTCGPLNLATSNEIVVTYSDARLCSIMPPTAFSPNGDGVNDTWEIKYLTGFPKCQVRVFSRFGRKLFDSVGYAQAWDGKSSGEVLPSGTYYYVISLEKGMESVSGSISIIK